MEGMLGKSNVMHINVNDKMRIIRNVMHILRYTKCINSIM